APGNAGTDEAGASRSAGASAAPLQNVALPAGGATAEHLSVICDREHVDLVVVGPEAPLVAGVADGLRSHGVRTFGPGALAARLEGSKAFMKRLAAENGIPTSPFEVFDDADKAARYIRQ